MAKRRWLKNTPWARGVKEIYSGKWGAPETERDLVFALLVWCGMPRASAFSVAYPDSKAEGISVPQLASRLVNSWKLRSIFNLLAKEEKSLPFRYPKDIEDTKHPYGW